MTPEEKAEHLINKFINYGCLYKHAKSCALIVVNECINSTQYEAHLQMSHSDFETTEYWIEVQNEIEKL